MRSTRSGPFVLLAAALAAATLSAPGTLAAQEGHAGHAGHVEQTENAASPYAEIAGRAIKALSEEDVAGLRDGAGMSMALPAELNGYPGPKHALDLAADLDLAPEQREALEAVEAAMSAKARELGMQVIEAEGALDALFAGGSATERAVEDAAAEVGRLRGALRATHLVAHVRTREILTVEQVAAYQRLRGYTPGG